ncbi:MAG TPA: pilus assembly protein TadG-related protein, partial [Kineosporiaceae bacterium]|nr:pilus assembly protein TadG-related protein [Kineosporiaceae bacterium]
MAVIVSLTVVAVLIPTSALAVDLGNVYVRTASLQRAADEAARAGAVALARQQNAGGSASQAMDAARTAAVDVLCHDPSLNRDSDGDGSGDGPWHAICAGGSAWTNDDDPSNGEVQFYAGAPSADHVYSSLPVSTTSGLVSGIRVRTPPSRVEYGLASAIPGQAPHTDPQRSATATLRTVLPKFGFLPLFAIPDQTGGFCIRSAPRTIWNPTHPTGACELAAPVAVAARGYLAVPRTISSEAPTVVWNTARGFDADHLPLRDQSIALAPQVTQSALVRDLSPGLFGSTSTFSGTGRLTSGNCPAGTATVSGGHAGVEGAHLADFVDTRHGGADALRDQVLDGPPATPSQSGWLDPRILRCG